MSETDKYIVRTMRMIEHLASLRGYEFDAEGRAYPVPKPILPGPVMVLPTTTGFKDSSDEIKVIAAILEEEVRDLLPPGSYAWERVAERVREKLQQRAQHVRNRAGRAEGKTERVMDHAFEPGKFSERCQVMLARYRCPYNESQHKINHQFIGLTADGDYCAVAVDDDFCGHRQAEHLTPEKVKTQQAARDALDTAKREVEERKAEVKPKYTPNCLACGVSRFFANLPARGSGHGTACPYYEPEPKPEPKPSVTVQFDYTEPRAAELDDPKL